MREHQTDPEHFALTGGGRVGYDLGRREFLRGAISLLLLGCYGHDVIPFVDYVLSGWLGDRDKP